MRKLLLLCSVILFGIGTLLPAFCSAQSEAADSDPTTEAVKPQQVVESTPTPSLPKGPGKVAIGIKMSSLGGGVEVATPVTRRTNVRVGVNLFNYSYSFSPNNGYTVDTQFKFLSVETHYDWFPFGGAFHLSPGVMLYNGNQASGSVIFPVGAGNSFTLGNETYTNANVTGSIKIPVGNKVAPTFLMGWGNLLPRKTNRNFSVPFEFGVVFSGSPKAAFSLTGNAIDSQGKLVSVSSAEFQQSIQTEQATINNDMSPFKYYPVISLGFGYRFGR